MLELKFSPVSDLTVLQMTDKMTGMKMIESSDPSRYEKKVLWKTCKSTDTVYTVQTLVKAGLDPE